jgi:hypothetical protein
LHGGGLYDCGCFLDKACLQTFLQRITAAQIYKNDWFKKGYTPAKFDKNIDVNFDDIDLVFSESAVRARHTWIYWKCFCCVNTRQVAEWGVVHLF